MIIWYPPGEAQFLEFRIANGSGWLTSHSLILVEYEPGQCEVRLKGNYNKRPYR